MSYLQVTGLLADVPTRMGVGNIYIREVDVGFTKKTWNYSLDSSPLSINVRVRTQDHIALDLHMLIQEDSALLKKIQQQVQQCLNQQLLDQAITRQKYPPAEELQTSSSNRGKQMLAAYDSGLQRNLPYAKNSRRFYKVRGSRK